MGDLMSLAGDAVRGCIVAQPGHKLVVADLANIEGRLLAWHAEEDWKLQAFRAYDTIIGQDEEGKPIRKGHDLYKIGAGNILGKKPEDVTKSERQAMGKVPELSLGYGGGHVAFRLMGAALGVFLPDEEAKAIVKGWRKTNNKIVQFWWQLDEAVREAILQPGVMTQAGKIKIHVQRNWLRLRLPSGRFLCYSAPAISEHPSFEGKTSVSYMGMDNYTRQWTRIHSYGPRFAADVTQATARDVLAHNMEHIEEAGFPVVLTVHDEVVTEPVDSPEYTSKRLEQLLAAQPFWADDKLPLAAAGDEMYRYAKTD